MVLKKAFTHPFEIDVILAPVGEKRFQFLAHLHPVIIQRGLRVSHDQMDGHFVPSALR